MSPDAIWYGQGPVARLFAALLAPLGWLYCGIAGARAFAYRRRWLAVQDTGAPVIVIGNLTVGGTGKTPLVIWLVEHLRRRGLRPGVVLRGYGGEPARTPRLVDGAADPRRDGDEPVLIAVRARCPVVVGQDRVAAARMLVANHGCDLVVADDGLQHYRLQRDCEILVIDGQRQLGNRRCLPSGPLREPPARARRADLTIVNGGDASGRWAMQLQPGDAVNLYHVQQSRPLVDFADGLVSAVAGIGNPARFFDMLRALGLDIVPRRYPDHHRYTPQDVGSWPEGPVLMTEKDAVKCRSMATPSHWYVPVQALPDAGFTAALDALLNRLLAARATRLS
ncbi:tetraacyldisaccharide 4'-kinase [Thiohalocapsa marina]|uniref:Tetraacyldisaccharide 4'-kinase n=1 Tax=Thiohalocapsa marina TaxID=424902 RepID=A0A5M8FR29_9GAMM|nr:tetraacyldisaccharide 4'-kinase [Thiohalocapsa marina]KAA6185791.1 tetraacyldisaccharide 4'-kinase [Thiohalocapsa marina]